MRKKKRGIGYLIPYIVNVIINVFLDVVIIAVYTNPVVQGLQDVGSLFGVEASIGDIMKTAVDWGMVPAWEVALLVGILVLQAAIAIYGIVLFCRFTDRINRLCMENELGNPKGSFHYLIVLLLSLVTLGIYYLYWIYRQGSRLAEADKRIYGTGLRETNGMVYMLLSLFGVFTCGITTCVLVYRIMNALDAMEGAREEAKSDPVGWKMEEAEGSAGWNQEEDALTLPVTGWANEGRAAMGRIQCCAGAYEGAEFELRDQEEVIIGRDETTAHVVIKNPKISRKHCGICYHAQDGSYSVTDYSTNGTYYKNGQRFPQGRPVACQAGTIVVVAQSGNEFLLC